MLPLPQLLPGLTCNATNIKPNPFDLTHLAGNAGCPPSCGHGFLTRTRLQRLLAVPEVLEDQVTLGHQENQEDPAVLQS